MEPQPPPAQAGRVTDRAARSLWTVAVLWGVAATAGLGALVAFDGLPPPPGPTGIGPHIVQPVTGGLVALFAAGLLLAAWREGLAALVLAIAAVSLSLVFAVTRPPAAAALVGVAFGVPPVCVWLRWQRHRPVRETAMGTALSAAVLAALLAGAWVTYDHRYGATHPESTRDPLPAPVEWVWAGGTTTDRATVVAKVDGDDDAVVELVVSDDDDLSAGRRVLGRRARQADGLVMRFEIDGLSPGREYHYALDVDGEIQTGSAGRLRTMPDGPASFSFAVSACARTGSNGMVFETIREREPLFYVNTGDFHYGDITTNSPERFRAEFDASLAAPAQSALYRSTSTAYVWDDHDFGGNNSDARSASRPAAQQVYREYVPHHPLAADAVGEGGVYHSFTAGRARVVLTDLRSYRSPQSLPDGPAKTMLGAEQLAWFADELEAAADEGEVVFWVSSTPWVGAPSDGADDWRGYDYERELIGDLIRELELVDQMVLLGGDAHMIALDDGTGSIGFPSLQAAALDRSGSVKAGPYSHGTHPGGGQFGEVELRDDGETVEVVLRGLTYEEKVVVEETFEVTPTSR